MAERPAHPLKVTLLPSAVFLPLPITLMRIICHSYSRGCLLFNWRLIFCSCHFKRENKGLPFILADVKEGRKYHSVWWLCNVFWVTDSWAVCQLVEPSIFSLIQGTEISFSHPVHQPNAVLLNLSLISRLVFQAVQRYKSKFLKCSHPLLPA